MRFSILGQRAAPFVVAFVLFPLPCVAELLSVGDAFPAWNLSDHNGTKVSSGDLTGKRYLLWFYPKASTPGCTMEGRGLTAANERYESAGIEILGVSFDRPADNARFVEEEGFPFKLLSDVERKLAVAVGAAANDTAAVPSRISYVVGPEGRVEHVYDDVDVRTHAEQVLADCGVEEATQD